MAQISTLGVFSAALLGLFGDMIVNVEGYDFVTCARFESTPVAHE